jgi:hypothetical protein
MIKHIISYSVSAIILVLALVAANKCAVDYLNLPEVYWSYSENKCVKINNVEKHYTCADVDKVLIQYVKIDVQ